MHLLFTSLGDLALDTDLALLHVRWNPGHDSYKHRTIVQRCWSDLSKELDTDDEIISRYNTIITNYNILVLMLWVENM